MRLRRSAPPGRRRQVLPTRWLMLAQTGTSMGPEGGSYEIACSAQTGASADRPGAGGRRGGRGAGRGPDLRASRGRSSGLICAANPPGRPAAARWHPRSCYRLARQRGRARLPAGQWSRRSPALCAGPGRCRERGPGPRNPGQPWGRELGRRIQQTRYKQSRRGSGDGRRRPSVRRGLVHCRRWRCGLPRRHVGWRDFVVEHPGERVERGRAGPGDRRPRQSLRRRAVHLRR